MSSRKKAFIPTVSTPTEPIIQPGDNPVIPVKKTRFRTVIKYYSFQNDDQMLREFEKYIEAWPNMNAGKPYIGKVIDVNAIRAEE